MTKVYLGLGTNLGNREANLLKAIQLIGERVGQVVRRSSFIDTDPWGFQSINRFMNAAIMVETEHTAREVLEITQQIERDMGRTQKSWAVSDWQLAVSSKPTPNTQHPTPNYTDRIIDIDILLFGSEKVDEPDLKIPHPLMLERPFVMIPLGEICNS